MNPHTLINAAFERHTALLSTLKSSPTMNNIEIAAIMLLQAAINNKTMMVCGNGGSAADAEHLAGEWVARYKKDRRPLSAIALATDTASLTAIANDYGYENIFARQIDAHAVPGDVLVAISTSGASANVLRALEAAKRHGMKTIMLTGASGAHLEASVDCCIAVPGDETARIQEMHEIIYHAWGEYVDAYIA